MPYGYGGTYVIHGPPGGGKTTRVAQTVRRILSLAETGLPNGRSPVIVCSLTRAAAAEAAGRGLSLPDGAVGTLHSFGFRSQDCPGCVNTKTIQEEWNVAHRGLSLSPSLFARSHEVEPEGDLLGTDLGDEMPGNEAFRQYELRRHRMTRREGWPGYVVEFAEKWESWKAETGLIDFTDMIEHGGASSLDPGVIIADEAQDLSRLEHAYLVRLQEAHDAALILVGDSNQSLFTWRGADPALLHDPLIPESHVDVLTQSYRVPAAVHRKAMEWIRQLSDYTPIEYSPRREDGPGSPVVAGRVVRCGATYRDVDEAIDQAEELAREGKRVLLLTTTNRMTGPMCAELRRRALPFSNPWRRKERAWNPLAASGKRICALLARRWTYADLALWVEPLRASGLLRRGAKKAILEARSVDGGVGQDQLGTWFVPEQLAELTRGLADGPTAALDWWLGKTNPSARPYADYAVRVVEAHGLEALEQEPRIHPSTIHGSKGGQADHVFVFPDLSRAAMDAWLDGGEGRDAVIRTFYVGMTRCRECLHVCEPAGTRHVEL